MDSPAVPKTNRSHLNAQLLSFVERSERALRKLSIFWRLALSSLAIIIVDSDERIREFLPQLDELITEGLVTIDPVEVVRYVGRSPDEETG